MKKELHKKKEFKVVHHSTSIEAINIYVRRILMVITIIGLGCLGINAQTVTVINPATPWTPPTGVTSVIVQVWGGGGGGGGAKGSGSNYGSGGGGGGGGGYTTKTLTVNSTQSYTIVVTNSSSTSWTAGTGSTAGGGGGAAGSAGNNAGGVGGTITFSGPGGSVVGAGGGGGGGTAINNGGISGNAGAAGTGGYAGGAGAAGGGYSSYQYSNYGGGGGGGAGSGAGGSPGSIATGGAGGTGSTAGGPGGSAYAAGTGVSGTAPGGGGGGGAASAYFNNSSYGGGAGGNGWVILTYTIPTSPTLSVSPTSLSFGNVCSGTSSVYSQFTITGSGLTSSVIVTPPANYSICATATGTYVTSPSTLTFSAASPFSQTIYVKFNPTGAASYNQSIGITSTGATSITETVTGTGVTALAAPSGLTPTSICPNTPTSISVTNNTNATSYTWSLPTGWSGTSSTNSITVTPNSTSGTVTVTANDGCTSPSYTPSLTVTTAPTAAIAASPTNAIVCGNTPVKLTASGISGTNYKWSISGNTAISTGLYTNTPPTTLYNVTATANPVYSKPTAAGSLTYAVTVTDGNNCTATTTKTVTTDLNNLSAGAVATNQTTCNNGTGSIAVTTTGGSGSYTYSWSPTASGQNPTGLTSGTYNVTVSDATCTTFTPATGSATITAPWTATASAGTPGCTTQLTALPSTLTTTIYSENFESYSAKTILPSGNWSTGYFNTLADNHAETYWTVDGSGTGSRAPIDGSRSLTLYNGCSNTYYSYEKGNDACDGNYYYYYSDMDFLAYNAGSMIDATGYSNLKLNFKWKCVGENSGTSVYDYGMVRYSTDGTNWYALNSTQYYNQSTATTASNIDLSVMNGQKFYIGFEWVNDINGGTDPPFVIDDISITGDKSFTYAWSDGLGATYTTSNTLQSPSINKSGTYTLAVTAGGCTSTATVNASVMRDSAQMTLATTSVNGLNLIEACSQADGWTYYATSTLPNNWLFGIYKNGNSFTPTVTLTVSTAASQAPYETKSDTRKKAGYTLDRYWNVSIDGSITYTNPIKVRFFYDPADTAAMRSAALSRATAYGLTDANINGLEWFKTTAGIAFTPANNTYSDVPNKMLPTTVYGTLHNLSYVEYQGLYSFSGGTAGMRLSPGAYGLPVELLYVTATPVDDSYIRIDWATASEINNMGFDIERSPDGINFESIGWADGHGNSNRQIEYSYNDQKVIPNNIYYYRLKQQDIDGNYEYSNIISGTIIGKNGFVLEALRPNPAADKVTLQAISVADQVATIIVTDMLGREMSVQSWPLVNGFNGIDIDTREFAIGAYNVTLKTGSQYFTKKLVIAR